MKGRTIVAPLGASEGWWAGAPGACYDAAKGDIYLTYRYRRPRGAEPERGGEVLLARSRDGIRFKTVWRVTKDKLGTPSMERSCLARGPRGEWLLYLSFVDPADNRWRIDVVEAEAPDQFDVARRQKVFTASDLNIEGVKDPYIVRIGHAWFMVVSYADVAPGVSAEQRRRMHATADAYDTGAILSHSGLAVSGDGRRFTWLGPNLTAFGRGKAWDSYSARIGSVVWTPPVFTAFYDGAIGVRDHYDERTGLAVGFDLRTFQRLTPRGPILAAPHGTGCLRYLDALRVEDELFCYYEFARPDGSHELRLNRVKPGKR